MRQLDFRLGLLLVLLALAGCQRDSGAHSSARDILQTRFPGETTAGGGTSGEVMARADTAKTQGGTPGIPKGAGGNTGGAQTSQSTSAAGGASGSETARGQGSGGGTPSIPEGAGGTPSGTQMGGTTPGAAASKNAPQPEHAGPAGTAGQGK
jgi:hypothetical protein